jgi:hypothetical protein
MRRPPTAGEWSGLECLQHLVDTERWVFPVRVKCFLEGRDFSAFNPDSEGTKVLGVLEAVALANEFRRLRGESLVLLEQVKPSHLARTARHPVLGPVTLGHLINEWAGHDLMHTVQGERALMQPFIEDCGPWLPSFADHVASKKA